MKGGLVLLKWREWIVIAIIGTVKTHCLVSADLVTQRGVAASCLDQLSSQVRKPIHGTHMQHSTAILEKHCVSTQVIMNDLNLSFFARVSILTLFWILMRSGVCFSSTLATSRFPPLEAK